MLIIRRAQIEALAKAALGRFERSMVDHMFELFPDRFADRDEAESFVRTETPAGMEAGFDTYADLALWLGARAAFGDALYGDDGFAWATGVIEDDELASPAKAAIFRRELLAHRSHLLRQWEAAAAWLLSLDR